MGILDLMNLNYNQIFNEVMKSSEAQSMVADFLNHCLLHCEETRECILDILSKDDRFKDLISESMENIINKSKIKSSFFK